MVVRAVLLLLAIASVCVASDPTADYPPPGTETQRAVIALLRQNRQKYGDDAAIMQGLLLAHASLGGAVLATESTIVGFEEREKRRYVHFRVDSGTIYDDQTFGREQRLEQIWHTILERTLLRYPTFSVPGDGIAVEVQYSHRSFESLSHLYETLDDQRIAERAKFYLLTASIGEFLARRIDAQGLLERSVVFIDEEPVKVTVHDFVGPPTPAPVPPE